MKNKFFFLVFLFFVSCDPDISWESTYEPSDKTYFNPPSWIQGVWINEDNSFYNVKFTSDDFIVRYYDSYTGVSYNERINWLGTKYLSCKEELSSGKYKVTITHLTSNITVWDFTSVSETEIHCDYDSVEFGERTVESFNLIKQ